MQHITTPDKSFLVGDAATDLLMRYAAMIAQVRGGDSVEVNAISGDGDEVVATLLIDSGSLPTAETTRSALQEPDNAEPRSASARMAHFSSMRTSTPTSTRSTTRSRRPEMPALTDDGKAPQFDDRLLAHLQIVIVQRLRRSESFLMSWANALEVGDGRSSVWMGAQAHPRSPGRSAAVPSAPAPTTA